MKLCVKYMGLELKSPLVAGSCGMTIIPEKVIQMEEMGIGAVVMKSLFEEQINNEIAHLSSEGSEHPEMLDYLNAYVRQGALAKYLTDLKELKQKTNIPIIASISCVKAGEWMNFAKSIEEAGADAIELNIYSLPLDPRESADDIEKKYVNIVDSVASSISIPVGVKISNQFTNIPAIVEKLKSRNVASVTMFNRFYHPDIDLNKMEMTSAPTLSTENEYFNTLRWVAITSSLVKNIDISASSGIHSAETIIKLIMAGATTVQLCSTLYKQGLGVISQYNEEIEKFLEKNGLEMSDLIGRMNYSNIKNPASFERVQFLKTFGKQE